MIGAQSGFEATFQEFIFYAGPIIQLAYWVTMIVAALWAVTLFKRWVDFGTGSAKSASGANTPVMDAAAPARPDTPSVDEFVE